MLYEVILDKGETPNKCSVAALSYRKDFQIIRVMGKNRLGPLRSAILLHHEGQCLTSISKSVSEIAVVDCVWRQLDFLLSRIEAPLPLFARIPEGFRTAYPRRSVGDTDPSAGLATIEAIFVASAILGKWDASLLSDYYFGQKFVEINRNRFLELGVMQAGDVNSLPVLKHRVRNSVQRRQDRGRIK
ncbi:MAG: hypothetical protein A3K03_02325 [Bdellovibrionales bacterium RIFOXYD1_FULL_44_7]|nr:MAG: hypothetical protein A3K03_02325 [Bdellovibrionales bacterium RIFOXYD1_FULL_44_7]